MSGSARSEAAEPAILSRRDAIIGALALAAGTLVAQRPETARAANNDPLLMGSINTVGTTTYLWRTSNGYLNPVYSEVQFGGSTNGVGAHRAASGHVYALAGDAATGVRGSADALGQFGVVAEHSIAGGTALRVNGKLSLSRSGRATIAKRHSTCTVTGLSGIGNGALVLATLQSSPGSGIYLKYAKRIDASSFKVYLNKKAKAATTFAWMILD